MKPSYSVDELAEILDQDVYTVANGLVAAGISTFHNGRKVDLADYECFHPMYNGESVFVRTGVRPSPNQYTIIVSTSALPELWLQSIKESHQLRSQDSGEQSVTTKCETISDNSLLATIAALLASFPKGKYPTGKDLEKAASSVGVSVSDDTIRKALNRAKEIAPGLKSA